MDDFKILARMLGVDKGDEGEEEPKKKTEQENKGVPIFGDPSEYEHMTQEQKDEITKNMMNKHKNWAGDWS